MQQEITTRQPLHKLDGKLTQVGWASKPLPIYDRSMVPASAWKIKEWDYYCVLSKTRGISFTLSDLGYIGFIAATVFDFEKQTEISNSITTILPLGSLALPASVESGDVVFRDKNVFMSFEHHGDHRVLTLEWQNFQQGKTLRGSVTLTQPPDENMTIVTPFENSKAFYYNHKINCMPAKGQFQLGEDVFVFEPEQALGVLDWGRGVWTYSNTWYWASLSAHVNDHRVGLNLGYGFGDTSAASENMLLVDGIAHKLDQITFHISEPDYMAPWKFSSNDQRLELDFEPAIDRFSNTNLLLVQSWQHQVFGYFSGGVVLDDGSTLELDRVLGFAEKVMNRW